MSTEVMLSNHLILCHPLLLFPSIFPSIRVSSHELAPHIRWPNYLSFSFSISPSSEYSGLISLRIDSPCSPRDSQESLPAWYFKSINSLVISLPYNPTLTSVHDYWKNHNFDYMDLCNQSDLCLLICCLGLSWLFPPRSKCLLISSLYLLHFRHYSN